MALISASSSSWPKAEVKEAAGADAAADAVDEVLGCEGSAATWLMPVADV